MSEPRIDLYIKPECPWCIAVVAWLKKNGYRYRQYDVISDEEKFDEGVFIKKKNNPKIKVKKNNH